MSPSSPDGLPTERLAENDNVIVSWSRLGGRGVFAARAIRKGEIIERAPYLRMDEDDADGLLLDYVFEDGEGSVVLPLGYGSLYNHGHPGNIEHYDDSDDEVFEYVALRDIEAGEELVLDYGDDWWETRDLSPG